MICLGPPPPYANPSPSQPPSNMYGASSYDGGLGGDAGFASFSEKTIRMAFVR